MMKNFIFTIAALLCFTATLPAQSGKQGQADPARQSTLNQPRKHSNLHTPFGNLNLSQEQKSQIKEIRLAAKKEKIQLRNQLNEKEAHLRSIEQVDRPDTKAINKTIDEIMAIKTQVMKSEHASKMKIRALLTEEQRVRFDSMKDRNGRRSAMSPSFPAANRTMGMRMNRSEIALRDVRKPLMMRGRLLEGYDLDVEQDNIESISIRKNTDNGKIIGTITITTKDGKTIVKDINEESPKKNR